MLNKNYKNFKIFKYNHEISNFYKKRHHLFKKMSHLKVQNNLLIKSINRVLRLNNQYQELIQHQK